MILTVTLNPSIDKTFVLSGFALNKLNRAELPLIVAGGKGVNAAVVLSLYGEEVVATGFLGGLSGRNVAEYLRSKDVTTNFAHIEESTRTNYIIFDKDKITQINEVGPAIDDEDLNNFLEIYERLLVYTDFVIIAGSIPPSVDNGIYSKLVKIAKEKDIKCLVNASGETLEKALESAPYIVKPDIRVKEKVLGFDLDSKENKIKVAQKILSAGTEIVLLSESVLAEMVVSKDKAFVARPAQESVKSRIGVQDSIIGGFTYGTLHDLSLEEAAKVAVCAGQAAANRITSTPEDSKEIESCKINVKIEELA